MDRWHHMAATDGHKDVHTKSLFKTIVTSEKKQSKLVGAFRPDVIHDQLV